MYSCADSSQIPQLRLFCLVCWPCCFASLMISAVSSPCPDISPNLSEGDHILGEFNCEPRPWAALLKLFTERKTDFDQVNSGSYLRNRVSPRRSLSWPKKRNPYNSTKASSNRIFVTSPLQYLLKCLRKESSLAFSFPPHATHLTCLPVPSMCREHSHFPRKSLSHPLQHHFPRMLLNTGVPLRQLGSGAPDGSGDVWWGSGVGEASA